MAVDIELRLRLSHLQRELESIPDMTRKQINAAVRDAEREWRKLPDRVGKVSRRVEADWGERMRGIRQVTANTFGDVVNDISDAVEAVGALGSVGVVAGGAVLGIAAASAAVAGTVVGIYELAYAAEEAGRRLDELPERVRPLTSLTEEQRHRVSLLAESWELVTAEVDALTLEIGAALAPTVLQLNGTFVDVASTARARIGSITDAARDLWWVIEEGQVITGQASRQQIEMNRTMREVLQHRVEVESLALRQLRNKAEIEEVIHDIYNRQADALRKVAQMHERAAKAAEDRAKREAKAEAERNKRRLEGMESEDERQANAIADAELNEFLAQQEAAAQALKDRKAAQKELARTMIDTSASMVSSLIGDQRALAAVQLAQTAGNAAVAISAALATGGPAGLALAGIVASALASTVQPLLTLAGAGNLTGGGEVARGDAQPRNVEMTQTASDGTVLVVNEFRHEVYDRGTEEALRRSGSPLREGVRSRQRRRR